MDSKWDFSSGDFEKNFKKFGWVPFLCENLVVWVVWVVLPVVAQKLMSQWCVDEGCCASQSGCNQRIGFLVWLYRGNPCSFLWTAKVARWWAIRFAMRRLSMSMGSWWWVGYDLGVMHDPWVLPVMFISRAWYHAWNKDWPHQWLVIISEWAWAWKVTS